MKIEKPFYFSFKMRKTKTQCNLGLEFKRVYKFSKESVNQRFCLFNSICAEACYCLSVGMLFDLLGVTAFSMETSLLVF